MVPFSLSNCSKMCHLMCHALFLSLTVLQTFTKFILSALQLVDGFINVCRWLFLKVKVNNDFIISPRKQSFYNSRFITLISGDWQSGYCYQNKEEYDNNGHYEGIRFIYDPCLVIIGLSKWKWKWILRPKMNIITTIIHFCKFTLA